MITGDALIHIDGPSAELRLSPRSPMNTAIVASGPSRSIPPTFSGSSSERG